MPYCKDCNDEFQEEQGERIDGDFHCLNCLYNGHNPFKIYPIGFVENNLSIGRGFGVRGNKRKTSKIHIFPSQKPFLYKVEDEKELTIIFYLHKCDNIKSKFKRGMDGKKVGVFASRTPKRPSRIAVSNVKLVKVERTTLYVKGLDAVNGTPVLDIKLGGRLF